MSYKPIAPAPSSTPGSSTPGPGTPVPTAGSVPSPSGSVPGAAAPFRPLFNDFGPPSMGYVQVSNEATRRPGLPEHLHGLAVGHRGDGQRDSAHLCWQQERHGAPEERHHPCPGPSQRVPGRDRAERAHVTGSTSTCDSGPFPATAGHLLLPGLHPELRFLSCVPWWVPSRNQGVDLTPVGGTNLGPLE